MKLTTHDLIETVTVPLFHNELVENDWAIYFNRPAIAKSEKSEPAIMLSEMFRNVGLVNHTLWKPYGVWANNEFI